MKGGKTMKYLIAPAPETGSFSRIKSFLSITINLIFKCFILLALIDLSSAGTNYYVATWGDNSNPGTFVSPWKNVSYAAKLVKAGDTIYLFNGTWQGENIIFTNSGTANNPISLIAYNGTPTLNGSNKNLNYIAGGGSYNHGIVTKPNMIIRGLKITNYWSAISGTDNLSIDNCELGLTGGATILLQSNSVLQNCLVYSSGNGANTVQLYNNNHSTNSIPVGNILIKNNTIHDAIGHNLIDFNGIIKNVTIDGNTLYNNLGYSGIFTHDPGVGDWQDNLTIINNIMYNLNYGIRLNNVSNSLIKNNIIYNVTAYAIETSQTKNLNFSENSITANQPEPIYLNGGINILYKNYIYGKRYRSSSQTTIRDAVDTVYSFYIVGGGSKRIEYINSTVFEWSISTGTGVFSGVYYEKDRSYMTMNSNNSIIKITTYPMTARPTSGSATVTVNTFDTSSAGPVLVDFTASTTNNNNVVFTISDLVPANNYIIKKGGINFATRQADYTGKIEFNNSIWSTGSFTLEKGPGTNAVVSGYAKDLINGSFLAGSTASLYYSTGAYTGLSIPIGTTGKFQFNNVPLGSYYVNISKAQYFSNRSSNFTVTAGATINAGNIILLDEDVDKDGHITVTDLNSLVNVYGIVDESKLEAIELT